MFKLDRTYNTLVLTPFALNIYDVNIVINHGVELKEKAPTLIKIDVDGILC